MEKINVFWFKRDLRLQDNPTLNAALRQPEPLLLLYVFEPSLFEDAHYDKRHWQFVAESLVDLNTELRKYNTKILQVTSEVKPCFERLQQSFCINTVFSTEETGLKITYDRDLELFSFFKNAGITWREFQNNGVVRGLSSRQGWSDKWYRYMTARIEILDFKNTDVLSYDFVQNFQEQCSSFSGVDTQSNHKFQKGGREEALKWKASFFNERLQFYNQYISKPNLSRYGCSRLSPYIAWGNLSIREVYQEVRNLKPDSPYKRQLNAFASRLRWQSHFIQKFEMEPRMEFEPVNKGFFFTLCGRNRVYQFQDAGHGNLFSDAPSFPKFYYRQQLARKTIFGF